MLKSAQPKQEQQKTPPKKEQNIKPDFKKGRPLKKPLSALSPAPAIPTKLLESDGLAKPAEHTKSDKPTKSDKKAEAETARQKLIAIFEKYKQSFQQSTFPSTKEFNADSFYC